MVVMGVLVCGGWVSLSCPRPKPYMYLPIKCTSWPNLDPLYTSTKPYVHVLPDVVLTIPTYFIRFLPHPVHISPCTTPLKTPENILEGPSDNSDPSSKRLAALRVSISFFAESSTSMGRWTSASTILTLSRKPRKPRLQRA